MDPNATGQPATGTPNPSTPAPAGNQGSASGPGSSGVSGVQGTANPAVTTPTPAPSQAAGGQAQPAAAAGQSGQAAPTSLAPQAQPSFDEQLRSRYGMDPGMLQTLLSMGWRQYQGQQGGQPGGQPAPAQPQATPEHPWGIPQFDKRLLQFVQKDPSTGQLVVLPGGPPDAAMQVQRYLDARQQAHERLLENPTEALTGIVTKIAQQIAQQTFQSQYGNVQAQQTVNTIFQQNSEWMFQRDPAGKVQQQYDAASGQFRPQLSPVGQYYAKQVVRAQQMGINDPQSQHDFAFGQTRLAVADFQAKQGQGQQQGQAANQQFLAAAAAGQAGNPNPQPAPSTTPGQAPLNSATLKDVMLRRMQEAGAQV